MSLKNSNSTFCEAGRCRAGNTRPRVPQRCRSGAGVLVQATLNRENGAFLFSGASYTQALNEVRNTHVHGSG
jgi:hypothetical protein